MSKFGELIAQEIPVLLSFYTSTSEVKMLNELLLNTAATLGKNAKVVKIDVDKNRELADVLRVKSLPTFILYVKEEMVWRESGLLTKNNLVEVVYKHQF